MLYDRIVVSLAGKSDEVAVVRESVRLAEATGAQLIALHVNEPAAGKMTMMMDATPLVSEEDVRRQFRECGFGAASEKLTVRIEESANLPKAIAKATVGADLLVIGHRQKNRFLSAIVEAVDRRLSDMVSCPVLVVPRNLRVSDRGDHSSPGNAG